MSRELILILSAICPCAVIKSAIHQAAIQDSLFEQPIESSHHRGVSKAGGQFSMQIAYTHLAVLPDEFHQLRFELPQLLYWPRPRSGFSLEPHRQCAICKSSLTQRKPKSSVAPQTAASVLKADW